MRATLTTLAEVAGIGLVLTGSWLIGLPFFLIAAGLGAIALGVTLA